MTGARIEPNAWFDAAQGQTPLDPDEAQGLRLSWVTTRGDLNVAEGSNIAEGLVWAEAQVAAGKHVCTEPFLRALHERMFGRVWKWAGQYRTTERNIGVDPAGIRVDLRNLFDDVAAWQEFDTYDLDEQAARLHHRLTWIHPFPNGNGRTSRAMADLMLASRRAPPFTWGAVAGNSAAETRRTYLAAVRAADAHDLRPLLAFVRS